MKGTTKEGAVWQGELHNNGCKDGHGMNKLINKQVKDPVYTLRHIIYTALGPCFYRPISRSWEMCSISRWSYLLSTIPSSTNFSRVNQGAQVNLKKAVPQYSMTYLR
ncbi:hypothetical protein BsWGS_20688 [Bradybaena similaris]